MRGSENSGRELRDPPYAIGVLRHVLLMLRFGVNMRQFRSREGFESYLGVATRYASRDARKRDQKEPNRPPC